MGAREDGPLDSLPRRADPSEERPIRAENAPDFELPEILREPDARVLVNRLIDEDPFQIAALSARRLRERALVLNPSRVKLSSMARVAIAARAYAGKEPLREWIELAIDASIDDLLREQREDELDGRPVESSPDAAFYMAFAEITGVDLVDARLACAMLNGMHAARRATFHAVIVQGVDIEEWAKETGSRPSEIHELLRQVGAEINRRLVKRRKARRRRL